MRICFLAQHAHQRSFLARYLEYKLALFRDTGASIRLYLVEEGHLASDFKPFTTVFPLGTLSEDAWEFLTSADLVIADISIGCSWLSLLPALAGVGPRVLLDYHDAFLSAAFAENSCVAADTMSTRLLVRNADAILTHSIFAQQMLHETTGVPAERIKIIALPCSLSGVLSPVQQAEKLPLGTLDLILFLGLLFTESGFTFFEKTLHCLHEQFPALHIVIICEVTELSSPWKRRYQELSHRLFEAELLSFAESNDSIRSVRFSAAEQRVLIPATWESAENFLRAGLASGVPVLAPRLGFISELLSDSGLTFTPWDVLHLIQQASRLLRTEQHFTLTPPVLDNESFTNPEKPARVAVVSLRYGTNFAGGAENSLRNMAEALHAAGHAVEVFTTCTSSENYWRNELQSGINLFGGIAVHRFAVDETDRQSHLKSLQPFQSGKKLWPDECERYYLQHSVRSTQLLEALHKRIDRFDAIIVGPYLFGLTYDIAAAFPEKTLLVPCFHDEPLARLNVWISTYERVGGILYHSAEEREFSQAVLGLNHPNSVDVGTYLPAILDSAEFVSGDTITGSSSRRPAGQIFPRTHQKSYLSNFTPRQRTDYADSESRYLVYCGRYSPQKNVPLLLEYVRRYHELRPDRFRFVFLGQGSVPIPRTDWVQDLGFLSEQRKQQVIGRATALVQLSHHESLSLVALEAWCLGVPVIADCQCAVLAGHIHRSGGGMTVGDFDAFVKALDDLWDQPQVWRQRGECGKQYVCQNYGSREKYVRGLQQAIARLKMPVWQLLFEQASQRRNTGCASWPGELRDFVDELLHKSPLPYRQHVEIRPQIATLTAGTDTQEAFVPVHLLNGGTHAIAATGLGRFVLCARVAGLDGRHVTEIMETELPTHLSPGQTAAAVLAVPLPAQPGRYILQLWAQSCWRTAVDVKVSLVELTVTGTGHTLPSLRLGIAQRVESALAKVMQHKQLPTEYTDISTGWFGNWKKWLKQKLLNNFKVQYTDVLSRQQSDVNEHLLEAVQQLAECCTTLDHAVQLLQRQVQKLKSSPDTVAPPSEYFASHGNESGIAQ